LFIPFSFRYSRVLFLYWFGGEAYRVWGFGHASQVCYL
jgi:hypothetical protein